MKSQTTVTITNGTYKNLNKVSNGLSWSGAIALLIMCTNTRTFRKIMDDKPKHKLKKEDRESGRTSFKVSNSLYEDLSKLSGEKSISIALDVLMEIYDKKKFKQYMKIKIAGR